MCKKKKKKKVIYIDDGHTVYDMNGLSGNEQDKKKNKEEKVHLSFKEKRAVIRAALERFLPVLFLVIACFTVTILLIYFWIK